MLKKHPSFYCQKACGEVGFSIEEWNEAYLYCVYNNLSKEETNKILHPELFTCESQCFNCMAIVGERRLKTNQ